jgi:hypothetical protein
MKKLGLSSALICMLLIAISAEASQITFNFDFNTLQQGKLYLNRGSLGFLEENVYAGKGIATVADNGFAPALSAGEIFDAYCADLLHIIYNGASPEVQLRSMQDWTQANIGGTDPGSYPWLNDPYAGEAASFLYDTYRNDGLGQPHKEYREAGLQLAIWEVLYEGSTQAADPLSFDIAQGNIHFSNFNSEVTNFASIYLNSLPNYGILAGYNAFWLQTADGAGSTTQDFIGPKAPNAVPESATMLLVGSGMILIIFTALRKQKKTR